MDTQKTLLLLLVVLVSVAFAARQASDKRQGKQKKQQRPGGWDYTGGYSSVDQNDENVQQLARFAVTQICSTYVVDAIEKAESQVVAGSNYRMDILVSKTWKCRVVVFEQTWTNTQELTSFSCKPAPKQKDVKIVPL